MYRGNALHRPRLNIFYTPAETINLMNDRTYLQKNRSLFAWNRFFVRFFLGGWFCFCFLSAEAQNHSVSGKVTDQTGAPLPGATIVLKGASGVGTVTDIEGNYDLVIPDGTEDGVLVVSFIGFLKEERTIGNSAVINVQLTPDVTSLDELVVIGYQEATRKSVTTAISSIGSEEISSYVSGNVANAFQGKVPGVQVLSGNGLPGSQPTILIRGLSSLTGNTTPLVIVDGVEVGYNSLNLLNPADIESIDVLKDASASAIYGSRSGQGVILVTTKSGEGKPVINFSSSVGFDRVPEVDMADAAEYARIMNQVAENSQVDAYFENPDELTNTDYWDRTFDTGIRQNYNLSARGGKEGLSLYGSLGYYKQDSYYATDKGGNWEKITGRLNADLTLGKIFKVGLSLSPRYERWLTSNTGNFWAAYGMDPTTEPYKTEEAVYENMPDGFMDLTAFNPYYSLPNRSDFNGMTNPDFFFRTNFDNHEFYGAEYGTYLEAEPVENLTLKTAVTGFAHSSSRNYYNPKYFLATNANRKEATVFAETRQAIRWKITNTADYSFYPGQHSFNILLGQSADQYTVKGTATERKDIPFDEEPYRHVSGAATLVDGTGYYQPGAQPFGKMVSYFGSLRYNFKDRYYVSGTMRADASSLVNPEYRWGYFPSLSAAWAVSDEPFFQGLTRTVNFLKVRASWGRAGGNLPTAEGAYLSTVAPVTYPDANGLAIVGYVPWNIANATIKWEVQEDYTIGIDAGLFDNKLNIMLEGYIRNPKNLLVDVNLDPVLGYPQGYIPRQPANIGELTTKGWDLALGYQHTFFDKLSFGANLTVSHFKSVADYVGNADPVRYGINNDKITTFRSRLTSGHEPGAWFGYIVDGVFQTEDEAAAYVNEAGEPYQPLAVEGDLKFRDVNNDGKIDNDDLTDIGSPWPSLTTGLTLTLNYGSFDFRAELYGAFGHEYNNNMRLLMQGAGHYNFISGWGDKFWDGPGSTNSFPILRTSDPNGNFSKMSTFMIEDADFVRGRLIQLGYTLPASVIRGLKNLRIYVSGQNLFTLTNYSGLNPELPIGSDIGLNGIDNFQPMKPRTYLIGLNLTF